MKELIRVKLAGEEFALSTEAFHALRGYLNDLERAHTKDPNRAENLEAAERRIAELILEQQRREAAVERPLIDTIISTLGYPAGYKKRRTNDTPSHPNTTSSTSEPLGTLGRIIVVGAKVLLGIFLVGWFLAAIGILVGFVTLVAMGTQWEQIVVVDGVSPVVFAGLICAVVVLFMGIVGDVGIRVLRGKALNFRKLGIAAIVWFIFFLSLIFVAVSNVSNWQEWAMRSEYQLEKWEAEVEALEDQLEAEWDEAMLNLQGIDSWDTTHTLTFDGLVGVMRLDSFCERFEQLDHYQDELELRLLRGERVEVSIVDSYDEHKATRTITIHTADGAKRIVTEALTAR